MASRRPRWRRTGARRGGSGVEYLIVIGMLALAVVGVVRAFGGSLRKKAECQARAIAGLGDTSAACDEAADGEGARVAFGASGAASETAPPDADEGPGAWDRLAATLAGGANPTSSDEGGKVCFGKVCLQGSCFVAGTEVIGADGPIAIQDVTEGSWVLSRDEQTGETAFRRVTRTFVHVDREVLELDVAGEHGTERLGVTPEHPFWRIDYGWVAAAALEPGDEIESATGEPLQVEAIGVSSEHETVFNFEVEGFHTYFVGTHGAWVHNDCPPEEEPLRKLLRLPPFGKRNDGGWPKTLDDIRKGRDRQIPLPKIPPSATPDDKTNLERLAEEVRKADDDLKKAEEAYRVWERPKMAEAMRKAPPGAGGFHFPLDDEGRKLADARNDAARKLDAALVKYVTTVDSVRGGGDIQLDGLGQPTFVRYPSGTSATITYDGPNIRSVAWREADGTTTKVYNTGEDRGRVWRLDLGRGKDDPVAFVGRYATERDGTITRTVGNRRFTLSPNGQHRVHWEKPDLWELATELPGNTDVKVTRAEDGIAISVRSKDAGLRSSVLRVPFETDREANPKIIKKDGDTILISLDGSDTPHVAVTAKEKPWGEGLPFRERRVPYYDAGNLRVVLRDLPKGTKALDVHLATSTRQTRHTWVTPLPADKDYILPPRWVPSQSGTWRGSLEPRFGWKRGNQFVADTTSSDRKFAAFVDDYMTGMVRGAPVVGPLVMGGEALTGSEITGRAMSPKERAIHGAFAVVGIGLDFGPAALEAAAASRAVSQIQKASGVTRAEAKALLAETQALKAEERALLKAAAEGKPVDPAKLAPIVDRLEKAMARVRPTAAADPLGAIARAEASAARPAVAGPAAAKEAVTARFGKSNPDLEKVLHDLLDDAAHRLNVTEALKDPATRQRTLDLIDEMAAGRALKGTSALDDFMKANPGKGPLYEPVAREVNVNGAGEVRKTAHVEAMKKDVAGMRVGPKPNETEVAAVRDYARYLKESVEPSVSDELAAFVRELNQEFGGGASFSVRTKSAEGLIDKVERMTSGTAGRGVRPDYKVGDVIDGVGGRITVENMEQLAAVLEKVKKSFGTGDGGRILEIENMYASPKASSPRYRVIPLIVKAKDGKATFELQLTTRRASVAADLDHNIGYKPLVPATEGQKELIKRMQAEAAALEQLEALGRRPLPLVPEVPGRGPIVPGNPGAIGPAVTPKEPDKKRDP